jgi:hypothetical protein
MFHNESWPLVDMLSIVPGSSHKSGLYVFNRTPDRESNPRPLAPGNTASTNKGTMTLTTGVAGCERSRVRLPVWTSNYCVNQFVFRLLRTVYI